MSTHDRVTSFANMANKTFKTNIAFCKDNRQLLNSPRFSTGILSLDLAVGGGWPFNKTVLVTGNESTGKTLIALKAAQSITNYDHVTKLHRDFVDPAVFEPGAALIVDVEGSFDSDWANKVAGFSEAEHIIVRPETSEQAIDLISSALEENCFDLIILDSLAAMSPQATLEKSIENSNIGLHARLNNEALRRWGAKANGITHTTQGPTLLLINQIREAIGVMFGNPETLPGGKGQKFSASIILRTGSAKILNGLTVENSIGEYKGSVSKNKTYKPKQGFEYKMIVSDGESAPIGDIDNSDRARKEARKRGLLVEEKGAWSFGDLKAKNQKELVKVIESDPLLFRKMWRSIVADETGYIDGKIQASRPSAEEAEEDDYEEG